MSEPISEFPAASEEARAEEATLVAQRERRARLVRFTYVAGYLGFLLVCASPAFLMPWEEAILVSEKGGGELGGIHSFRVGMLLGTFVLAGVPVGLIGLFLRGKRAGAALVLLACAVAIVAIASGRRARIDIRREAFARLAERSKPLVAAIHAYERDHGAPPPNLEALVPTYLPAVPSTGMGSYPDYGYSAAGPGCRPPFEGNPWGLVVECGWGLSFDSFRYLPLGNYPERGFGGDLERVGEWAYVHE